jgi:predicted nucleic acid-binding protein
LWTLRDGRVGSIGRNLFHAEAVRAVENVTEQGHFLITTSYVLLELTALLSSPLRVPKPIQIQLLANLRNDPTTISISIESEIDAEAWNLWSNRQDKEWSLVDCSSFVVMERRKLTHALTTDQHFEQAGFVRMLK